MPNTSISRIPAHWATELGNAPAISHEGETVGWRDLDRASNQLARHYANSGVAENDLVTVALPNGIEFFIACFAIWKLGATPQPVSARLPKAERDQIIELAQPSLIVGVDAADHPDHPCLPIGVEVPAELSSNELPEKTAKYVKAMTSGGSTGRPKLIVARTSASWDIESNYMFFPRNRAMLVPGPLYHNGPFMWSMIGLFKGNHVCTMARFDAENTLRLLEQYQVDLVYMVPTMMQRIWNLPTETRLSYDLTHLRILWHLAAPCPAWLKEAFIDWLGPDVICELYGGTEAQGFTIIRGSEWLSHRGSVGRPVEGCAMQIVDDQGKVLPPGDVGEVFIRSDAGPGSSYHYVGAEAKVLEGGWESLGDMGYMDEEGFLYLTDRRNDMILSGGANIYPAEVEAAIDAFSGVRSSAVIGLPHDDMGNAIHAIVDTGDESVDEAALMAHLQARLVSYKLPRSVEFVTTPLRDDAGKVRRAALRAERIAAMN